MSIPTANPTSGISIGTIAAGGTATVSFQGLITSLPASGQIFNQASVSYSSGIYSGNLLSNITNTLVYQSIVGLVKSANISSVTVGNVITYNVAVQNTGNIAAQVTLMDNVPSGTSFVPNSVTVAGISVTGQSPITGIAVGSIPAGGLVNVTFQFLLNTLPSPASVVNQATASYTYLLSTGRTISSSSTSNTLSIPASLPSVTVTKSVNSLEATINDVLTYTLIVKNNGTSSVTNVIVSDLIPSAASFVTGSVILNGSVLVNAVPANGITIGTLTSQASATLTFQVKVVSIPDASTLNNRASVAFTSGSFTGSAISNNVTTNVYQAIIGIVKSASTIQATLGDTFTYMFQMSNTGNTSALVTLTDQIPAGCTFVANSVLVAGSPNPGVSPITGINLGTLNAGSSISVSYVVTITSFPLSKQLVNQASTSYTYSLPSGRQVSGTSASNTVTIPVAIPSVGIVKSTTRSVVVTGDVITYAFVVTNSGITAVNNVIVQDSLASNTAFILGSVIVNGASKPGANPSDGIPVGTLAPGTAATLTFEVRITMPIPSQITNQSTASFTSGVFSGSASSNIITTPVVQPQISLVKSANTVNATIGDAIIYTITVNNTGNLPANVTLTDIIPQGTTFTVNSVIVDGFPQPGISPATGINLGSISPSGAVIVTFGVVATLLPTPQFYSNQATVSYTYTPPDGRTLTGNSSSNIVTFPVSAPNVNVTKTTVSSAATVGDTLIYAIAITNNGIETVNSVQFSDPPPAGTSFVAGSVSINGVTVPSANPTSGFNVGSIAPGVTTSVVFNAIVNSVPSPATLDNRATVTFTSGAFSGSTYSNTVTTPVYQPLVTVSKSANTANATVGDTVSYTFIINNSGNYGSLVTLTDNIPSGTSFVVNSVLINGVLLPGADPIAGINAGIIGAGQTTTVVLSVLIDSLPSPQQLVNQGTVSSAFTLPDGRTLTRTAKSNTVTIPVSAPNVTVVKSTASTSVTAGDVVTYVTTITNKGIASVNNVLFTDTIPVGAALVPGSVSVDGTIRPTANPSTGIILGSIAPSASVAVAFNIIVNSLPASALLTNQSSVSFTSGVFSGVTFSNTVTTPVYLPLFKALKSANTTNATVGDTVVYTINVNNTGNFGAQVILTDSIPAGTTFSPNSVIVNGQSLAGADPSTGIPLGIIATNAIITFSVIVNAVPTGQQLINQASATYSFALPDGRIVNNSFTSNTVTIPVSSPNVTVSKTTTSPDASFGDTVTYTVTITNNGIENVNNVVFTDAIPSSTTFIPGSVTVNGVSRPSASPTASISLGTIAPGATDTVTFSVTVVSIPPSGQLANQSAVSFTSGAFSGSAVSNTNVIPIYQAIVKAAKTANTINATVGDTVNYSVALTNIGNLPAQATLTDPIPTGAVFVPNSILVNGVPQPGADPNLGVNVGTIAPGATVNVTVTLEVTIDTLPQQSQLSNQAFIDYVFTHPDGRVLTGSAASNILIIPVSSPNLSVVKSTTAIDAVVGDVITYTIVVTNNGIEAVNNVVLVDPIPTGTTFVVGSVTVDGIPKATANPSTGIPIGIIAPASSSVVAFRVQVVTL
ncbi:beta strand repeat-containing protein [Paenibacillus pini]|uniref:beta strand repeat-containing protein n=1 Tax=Paenibacillus pini TaxID=669461 RepID=UPI001F5AA0A8|nr:hypothetical protein [Paenibacillus pini]